MNDGPRRHYLRCFGWPRCKFANHRQADRPEEAERKPCPRCGAAVVIQERHPSIWSVAFQAAGRTSSSASWAAAPAAAPHGLRSDCDATHYQHRRPTAATARQANTRSDRPSQRARSSERSPAKAAPTGLASSPRKESRERPRSVPPPQPGAHIPQMKIPR
jgi:hypothetical protein